jgi:2-polyprenyl-6-methoxyphenol hydroxylase-like FAD-dependent oxidoreductase
VCTYDVVVAGGTLGVFVAVCLAQQGLSVAVVERGKLAGRTQEWNISRKELQELVQVCVWESGVGKGMPAAKGGFTVLRSCSRTCITAQHQHQHMCCHTTATSSSSSLSRLDLHGLLS